MRLEHLEVHLNELFHDLNSPLSSMRLQLGLLREAVRADPQLSRRAESAERQLVRAQRMIDVFVSSCALRHGRSPAGAAAERVFERYGISTVNESGTASIGLDPKAVDALMRSFAEACLRFMESGTPAARIAADERTLVVRVSGRFDQQNVAQALRLSFVADDGEPELALAATRIGASAANGTLLVERGAIVLRVPLVIE